MSTEEQYGVSLLTPLRTDPPSTGRVDVAHAVRVGGRRRRARRAGTIVGSAALAVMVSVGVVVAPSLVGAPQAPVDGSVPSSPAADPRLFDPLVRIIDVNARDFLITEITTARYWQSIVLSGPAGAAAPGVASGSAVISVYPIGERHLLPDATPWQPDEANRAEPVNGRPAYWLATCSPEQPCPDRAVLIWEWSASAWASSTVQLHPATGGPAPSDSAARAFAHDVASVTRTDVRFRVTTPMTAPAPAGTHLTSVLTGSDSGGAPYVTLTYGYADPVQGLATDERQILVTLVILNPNLTESFADVTLIDGKLAWVKPTEITIFQVAGGWSLRVTAPPSQNHPLGTAETLLAFTRSVRVVSNPNDTNGWN